MDERYVQMVDTANGLSVMVLRQEPNLEFFGYFPKHFLIF